MKTVKTISIKCETKDIMKLEDMTVLQGNLKARTDDDYEKIKKSIYPQPLKVKASRHYPL